MRKLFWPISVVGMAIILALVALPGSAAAAVTLQGSTVDFGQGGSKIYDNGDLRIETDDNLYVTAKDASFSGNLTVTKDLIANYPIHAKGNLIKFGGNATTTLDFGRGGSSIYDNGNLTVKTDDNLNLDAITVRVGKDLNVDRNAAFVGATEFKSIGGNSVKPNNRFRGYTVHDGTVKFNSLLQADSETDFNGSNTFDGAVDFNSTVNFTDATVTGLTLSGSSLTSTGTLSVTGASTLTGLVTATAGVTTPANLTTTGTGDLVSADDLTVADDAAITGLATIGETLTVTGASTLTGLVTATAGVTTAANLTTTGTGDLVSADDLTVADDAAITGLATIGETLGVTGATTLTGLLTTNGGITIGANALTGTTGIIDYTNFDVDASGNITNVSAITTDGAYTQTGTGANTLSGATTFSAAGTALTVDNNATITGTLTTGTFAPTTLTPTTLTVSGLSTLNGGLTMDSGAFAVADTSGNITGTGTYAVTGVHNIAATTVATTVLGTLNVDEAVTFDTTLGVTGATTVAAITGSGLATLNGGLTMDSGAFAVADTSGNITGTGTYAVTGVHNIAATTVATTVLGTLNVDEAVTFDTTLGVTGNTTLTGDLAVNGDDITSDGVLTVSATGYTRIGDTATPGSATGDDALFVEGGFEVDGASTLDGTLSVTGASTFNGAVTMNSSLTGSGTLTWSGTASLTGSTTITNLASVTVAGASDLRGAVANSTGVLNFNDETSFTPTATTTTNVQITATATTADAVDLNAVTVTTGRALDITATGLTTGAALNVDTGTARTSGAALTIDDDSVGATVTGDLIQIDVAGTPDTNLLDFDITGVTTGNTIDVTYSSGASTGNAIDLNMGTDVTGNALDIATAATTGNAIDITTTGVFTNDLIDINVGAQAATGDVINVALGSTAVAAQALVVTSTGASSTDGWVLAASNTLGIWTGDMINLTSGTGDASGDFIGMTIEAGATDVQAVTVSNAAASDQAGWLLDVDTSAAWTSIAMDIDIAGAVISTGNFLDVAYATGAHTGNAIDLNMGTNVAGDAVNIASAATTGNALDITSSGIFTNDLIDINVGAQAATGDVMNISLGATAVAAQALVVDSGGASSTDGWVLAGDNSGNGIWTGDMINLRSGTGDASGDFIDLTFEAGATDAQGITFNNAAASDQAGWGLHFLSSAAFTSSMIAFDNTANSIWTGDLINVTTGTGDASGDIIDMTFEAGATDVQGIVVTNAAASDQAGWLMDVDTSAAWTGIAMDIDIAGAVISTGNFLDVAYATGAHTGNAIDLNMGTNVAGDAINIASIATTGNALDITASGVFTNELIDINIGAVAATGDVINIAMGATAVAAQAIVVNSGGAMSTDGWVLAADNGLDAIWTGDMINLRSGTGDASGDFIDLTFEAGATDAQGIVFNNAAATDQVGWGLSFLSSAAFTSSMIAFDNTANSIWTGDLISITTGTGDASGVFFAGTIEAGATDVQAFQVTNAAASDQAGWLMDVDTSAAWTGIGMDIDIAGAVISTGNFLDVTYATGAHTGNAIDLNMGTDVTGNALDIATAATTGNAIDITTTGVFTNDLIDINVGAQAATGDVMNIALGATAVAAQALVVDSGGASTTDGWVLAGDNSGNGIWTGDMINLRSGTGDASGDFIDLTFEAGATDAQGITFNNAAASDQAGWGLHFLSSAAFTSSMIAFDNTANSIWTGDLINVTTGTGDASGDIIDITFEAGATDVQAIVLTNSAATDQAGWFANISSGAAFTSSMIAFDNTANSIWTGDLINVTTGTGDVSGDIIDMTFEAGATDVQGIVINNAAATDQAGWGLSVLSSAAFTASMIQFDNTANSIWTGNLIDVDTGTGDVSGNIVDLNFEAGATDVQALVLNNAAATDQAGWLMDINTTGIWTGIAIDVDFATVASTGNFLDIAYADAAHTGDTIAIATGTNLAGNAMQVTTAGARTAPVFFVDGAGTDGGVDDHIIDIDQSGLLNSNVLDITYSSGASDGNAIDLNMGTNIAGDAININQANATTGDGLVMVNNASATAAYTGNMVFLDFNQTHAEAAADDDTGVLFRMTRDTETTDAGGTLTVSGDMASLINTGTQTAGTLTQTARMLFIDQNYAASTGDLVEIENASGADALFIDQDGVGGVAINIDSEATTGNVMTVTAATTSGNFIDLTTEGIWTTELIDINVGAQAATGDVMNVALGATAVAAQALVIDSGGASTTDGWVLAGDNSGNGIWTGDMINLRSGTGDASGDFIDITMEALATDVQGIVINNAAATDQVGWGLQFLSSAAFTSSMIAFDNTANSIWTGDLISITTGTGDASGVFFAGTIEAGATDVQAFQVTNAAASDQAGWLLDVDTSAAWTGIGMDIDIAGAVISTGNFLDVTYASGAHTGNAIDLNMGTNVAGDAINIGGALTTGQAIAVSVTGTHTEASSGIVVLTATGVLDNPTSLTDIDGSGVLRLSAEGEQDDYALIVADGEVVFSNTSNLSFDSQIFTSAGAGTLTPTSTFVVADNTAAEAALTLGETGVQDGQLLIIAIDVTSAAAYTIADTDGVANTSAALTLGVGDTVVFIYDAIALEWVQLATSNN